MSSSSQAHSSRSLNKDTFSATLPKVEQRQAKGFSFPVRGPEAGRAASPVESMPPLQDSASQASLTPFSATGTGRSDPGRPIDVTSDQRLSAVISDVNAVQLQGDLFRLPLNMPTWSQLLIMMPHSVLLGGGLSIPLGWRTPSPQSPIPLQDRDSPGRGYGKLVIGYHDSERSRTSRGDTSETLEVALSRIMDEEDFKSFKTDIDSISRAEFIEREAILKSELAQVFSVSNQKIVDVANENILQQQAVMSKKIA